MCGSLKLENSNKIVPKGGYIPGTHIQGANPKSQYKWESFARTDGSIDKKKTLAQQWPSDKWKVTYLKTDGYSERDFEGRDHPFNSNKIGALISEEKKEVRILTRPARTDREIQIHHRAPSKIPDNMTINEYTHKLNQLCGGNFQCLI